MKTVLEDGRYCVMNFIFSVSSVIFEIAVVSNIENLFSWVNSIFLMTELAMLVPIFKAVL